MGWIGNLVIVRGMRGREREREREREGEGGRGRVK